MPRSKGASYTPPAGGIAREPNWTTLPQPNILTIEASHKFNTDIDANGVGRVQLKAGYNADMSEIRYTYKPD